jgi:hypothetical protein
MFTNYTVGRNNGIIIIIIILIFSKQHFVIGIGGSVSYSSQSMVKFASRLSCPQIDACVPHTSFF